MKGITTSEQCMKCRGCCQFLADELYFAPVVTKEELAVIQQNYDTSRATILPHNKEGTIFQISPIPSKKHPEEYVCPFYDEETTYCTIYKDRPLDCRLWPIMIAKSDKKNTLSITRSEDSYCPALQATSERARDHYKTYIVKELNKEPYTTIFSLHPDLAWDLESDMIPLGELKLHPEVKEQI